MRVLHVEDNAVDADLIRRHLSRLAPDITLMLVNSMAAAQTCLQRPDDYDLVLVDLKLPDGSGLELLAEIRQRQLPLAVVMLPGFGDQEAAIASLKAGADDYLSKQGDLSRLPVTLREAWRRFKAGRAHRARPLRVLYAEHNPADIDLTRRYLAQHAPHIQLSVVADAEAIFASLPTDAKTHPDYDVVMLDYRLTGLDALEVTKALRMDRGLSIPIVLVSGHGSEEVAVQALHLGADEYLTKNPGYLIQLPATLEKVQRQAELEHERVHLRKSQAALARAQEIAHVGNWSYRMADGYMECSDELYRIFGFEPQSLEINYDRLIASVHADDRAAHDAYLQRLFELEPGSEVGSHEYRLLRPDGEERWVQIEARADFDEHGHPLQLVSSVLDITERKHTQAEHEHLNRELQQAHKMQALGQLTGGIAHDFNNLLGIIMGFTQLALVPGLDQAKRAEYLKQVSRAGKRAKQLVAQMLAFSRGDGSKARPLQFYPQLREDIKLLRSSLPSSILIDAKLQKNLPEVLMDSTQLNQILMNLCINARDAMHDIGTLTIQLGLVELPSTMCSLCYQQVKGRWVELSVSDTGGGMEQQTLERLFEPFFTTKEVGKGTGMGLAVVSGIVKRHGGHVLVSTELGKGSRFRLLFPPLANPLPEHREPATTTQVLPRGREEQLLVVDDEPDLAEYLRDLLHLYDYQASVVTDSGQALALFRENPDRFALLLTDQTMPGMTGVELIHQVRKLKPEFPVILTSGFSENGDAWRAGELGIPYFSKPIDSAGLIRLLNKLLQPAAQ